MEAHVLICTHNGQKYLSEQIESISSQTRAIDQIHIHDYGSTDKSREIILEYARANARIHYLFFQHAPGPSLSFIRSLNYLKNIVSEGSTIFLSDQDDVWLDNKVSRVLEKIEEGAEFVFHDVEIVNEHGKGKKSPENFYGGFWNIERDLVLPDLFFANPVIGHTCAITVRALRKIDLSESVLIPMHDWYICTKVVLLNVRFNYLPEVMSLYRQHDSNILGKKSPYRAFLRILKSSERLASYHKFLEKYEGVEIKSKDVLNLRPLSKLVYVSIMLMLIKLFRYDKF